MVRRPDLIPDFPGTHNSPRRLSGRSSLNYPRINGTPVRLRSTPLRMGFTVPLLELLALPTRDFGADTRIRIGTFSLEGCCATVKHHTRIVVLRAA